MAVLLNGFHGHVHWEHRCMDILIDHGYVHSDKDQSDSDEND
jgi:hypothetical protein